MIPSDLASFVACHEARDYVGADNDPQDHLLGKYGGPDGQVQAVGGQRPLLKLSGAGGFQCLRFDDVDDELKFNASTSLAGPYTIFNVYAGNGSGAGHHRVLSGEAAFNGGWGDSWRMMWTSALGGVYQVNAYPTNSEINAFSYVPGDVRIHVVTMGTPFTVGFKYYINNGFIGNAGDATGPGVLQIGRATTPAFCDWIATITFDDLFAHGSTEMNGIFNYIVQDILGGGMQRYSQANIEAVMTAASNIRFSQTCIEYVRSVAEGAPSGQKFNAQVIG